MMSVDKLKYSWDLRLFWPLHGNVLMTLSKMMSFHELKIHHNPIFYDSCFTAVLLTGALVELKSDDITDLLYCKVTY